MTDIGALRDLLVDSFQRVHELVQQLTDGLTEEAATFRPDPDANSAAWLLWHVSRVQDDHVAELAGGEQALARLARPLQPALRRRRDRLRTGLRGGRPGAGQRRAARRLPRGRARAVPA